MNTDNYEVLVVGGGISGSVAAIAAARNGARTLLVERYGFLGGVLTAAGVGPMMTFHAGDLQVIRGITGELVSRLESKGFSPGHILDSTGYTYSVTPFDAEAIKIELETMLLDSGGEVLFHTSLASVKTEGAAITGLTVCNKAGLGCLAATVYVDATGDADLSAWAGVPVRKGRPSDGQMQPLTMNVKMYGVDIAEVRRFIKEHPEEFPRLAESAGAVDAAERLSIGGFVGLIAKGREAGEITFSRDEILFFETNNPGEVIVNTTRITGEDPTDPRSLSRAEVEGRRQAAELVSFLRRRVPGFRDAKVLSVGPFVGARSSRQIEGLYTITAADIMAGVRFEDAVACYAYPIDVHSPDGTETTSRHLSRGLYYTIPYRALINARVRNLITVGRCISGDFEAQAAFRTSPGAGAIGEAGGTAAALAVRSGRMFPDLDVESLKRRLREQAAYLGEP